MTDSLYVLAVLNLLIAVSDFLVRKTPLRHVGSALLVILLAAVTANLGLLPLSGREAPVYGHIFGVVAPAAIFLLLLEVRLRDVMSVGWPLLILFMAGSLGSAAGALIGFALVGDQPEFGASGPALAGMFAGTYSGGSVNFNAIALHYDVVRDGVLYAGAVAVDNILTALWMILTIAAGRMALKSVPAQSDSAFLESEAESEKKPVDLAGLGWLLSLTLASVYLCERLSIWLASLGIPVPSILLVTTAALVLAQSSAIRALPGKQLAGMYAIHLFLAVIGAHCDLVALSTLGRLGLWLAILAFSVVAVHALSTVAAARLLGRDWDDVAVASQANVGGAATALALAGTIGRPRLMLPGVLLGTFGYALGTYLGFLVVWLV